MVIYWVVAAVMFLVLCYGLFVAMRCHRTGRTQELAILTMGNVFCMTFLPLWLSFITGLTSETAAFWRWQAWVVVDMIYCGFFLSVIRYFQLKMQGLLPVASHHRSAGDELAG
jgi:hypothetical protein